MGRRGDRSERHGRRGAARDGGPLHRSAERQVAHAWIASGTSPVHPGPAIVAARPCHRGGGFADAKPPPRKDAAQPTLRGVGAYRGRRRRSTAPPPGHGSVADCLRPGATWRPFIPRSSGFRCLPRGSWLHVRSRPCHSVTTNVDVLVGPQRPVVGKAPQQVGAGLGEGRLHHPLVVRGRVGSLPAGAPRRVRSSPACPPRPWSAPDRRSPAPLPGRRTRRAGVRSR